MPGGLPAFQHSFEEEFTAMADPQTPPAQTPPAQNPPPAAPQASYMRVIELAAVTHPEHGGFVTPSKRDRYKSDDPLVKAYPWMFEPEDTPPAQSAAGQHAVTLTPERGKRAPRGNTRTQGGK